MKPTKSYIITVSTNVLLLFAILSALPSCKNENPAFNSLAALEGTWVMKFDSSAVYERWDKVNDTLFTGLSYEIDKGDSVLTETLQIVNTADGIFYIPTVVGQNDGKAVKFKLVSSEGNIYSFENPQHDFPTNISYQFISADQIKASVSGLVNNEMRSLDFDYQRVK
jgi:hypothetical protein